MNILRAEAFLTQYGCRATKLSALYDDDDMLQDALATLFPSFEYPAFSSLTIGEILSRYKPLPLASV